MFDAPGPAVDAAVSRAAPVQAVREHARRLLAAWMSSPAISGAAVALALRTAAEAATAVRHASSLEVTWTGPAAAIPVRMTEEVILDLVREASRSLLFMSYSASEITELVERIRDACARGVDVTMVFESREGSGGTFAVDAADAYGALGELVRFLEWPLDERDGRGRMHAKAVVADESVALVSSANLSRAAMGPNMELGLVVRGGPVPAWLAAHVRELAAGNVLRQVD